MMETIALLLINLGINMIVVGGLFWLQYGIKNRKGPSAPSPIPFKVESKTTVSPVNQAYRFLDWSINNFSHCASDDDEKIDDDISEEMDDLFKSCLGVIRGGIIGGENVKDDMEKFVQDYEKSVDDIRNMKGSFVYQPTPSDLDDNNPPRSGSGDKPSAPYRLSREALDSLVHISSNKEIIATDDPMPLHKPKPPQDRFVVEDEIPHKTPKDRCTDYLDAAKAFSELPFPNLNDGDSCGLGDDSKDDK